MTKQSGTITTLNYRVASKQTLGLLFDNQIELLLCCSKGQRLDSFMHYAVIGKSGTTLDSPALLNSDMLMPCCPLLRGGRLE